MLHVQMEWRPADPEDIPGVSLEQGEGGHGRVRKYSNRQGLQHGAGQVPALPGVQALEAT